MISRIQLKWMSRAAPFAGLWLVIEWILARRQDADFGWHYRSGEHILAHGVPARDIFTYTAANFDWINHEWLHDALIYAGSHWLGYGAVATIFAGLWVLALGVATKWRLSWTVAGVTLAALVPYVGVRPVTWTALGLAVILRLLEARRYGYLPLVFGLWANLHGGFALGLVVMAVQAVWIRSWRAGLWVIACSLATLINPYGWKVYVEIMRTMGDPALRETVVEWMPLSFDFTNGLYLVVVILTLALLVKQLSWRRWLGLGLVLLSLGATRQLPLLVIATVGTVQAGYEWLLNWLKSNDLGWRWWQTGMAVSGVVLAGLTIVVPPVEAETATVVRPYRSVIELRDKPCGGRIFNHYSFGGYLIQWLPGTSVYIDGRMPSWSGAEGRYLDRWQRVMKDTAYAEREFERYNVQCVLITRDDRVLADYLERSGWRRSVTEVTGVLWRRD